MPAETPWKFDLCGGHAALDFANTVSNRHTSSPIERLVTYADLLAFAQQSGLLPPRDAARLRTWARENPGEADTTLAGVHLLRDSLYRLFATVAEGGRPARADLAVLNGFTARLRLGESLDWEWSAGEGAPDALLAPIVRAALDLLTTKERSRVSLCAADDCVWLFLDTSKNRTRRWCDMKVCGNRSKARRHYQRHHPDA